MQWIQKPPIQPWKWDPNYFPEILIINRGAAAFFPRTVPQAKSTNFNEKNAGLQILMKKGQISVVQCNNLSRKKASVSSN